MGDIKTKVVLPSIGSQNELTVPKPGPKPKQATLTLTESKPKASSHKEQRLPQFIARAQLCHDNLKKIQVSSDLNELYVAAKAFYDVTTDAKVKSRTVMLSVMDLLLKLGWVALVKDILDTLIALHPNMLTADIKIQTWAPARLPTSGTSPLKRAILLVDLLLMVSTRFTNYHDPSILAAGSKGLLDSLIKVFLPPLSKMCWTERTAPQKLVRNALYSIYNCSAVPENHKYYQAQNVVQTVLGAVQTGGQDREDIAFKVGTLCLLTAAYLLEEKDKHLIVADKGPIIFLVEVIREALRNRNHSSGGYSASEAAMGLTQLLSSDEVKRIVGQNGGISVFTTMLQKSRRTEESVAACRALWALAFDVDNRKVIQDDADLIKLLTSTKASSNDSALLKASSGVLWEIRDRNLPAVASETPSQDRPDPQPNHVMISYQWDAQETVVLIRNELKRKGYKVWLDIDDIGGSTVEAMALAVEQSAVVILCLSKEYKKSLNCRSEAEYAFQLRKPIVPVKVESAYCPDGWLGILVGTRLWFNFYDTLLFKTSIDKLENELKRTLNSSQESALVETTTPVKARQPSATWDNQGVITWLESKELLKELKEDVCKRLTGRHLYQLYRLSQRDPSFYHASLKTDFGLRDVLVLLEFSDAVSDLFQDT